MAVWNMVEDVDRLLKKNTAYCSSVAAYALYALLKDLDADSSLIINHTRSLPMIFRMHPW